MVRTELLSYNSLNLLFNIVCISLMYNYGLKLMFFNFANIYWIFIFLSIWPICWSHPEVEWNILIKLEQLIRRFPNAGTVRSDWYIYFGKMCTRCDFFTLTTFYNQIYKLVSPFRLWKFYECSHGISASVFTYTAKSFNIRFEKTREKCVLPASPINTT